MGDSERSLKWTVNLKVKGHGSKWTVLQLKVDRPHESKDKSGRSINVKVDDPQI